MPSVNINSHYLAGIGEAIVTKYINAGYVLKKKQYINTLFFSSCKLDCQNNVDCKNLYSMKRFINTLIRLY